MVELNGAPCLSMAEPNPSTPEEDIPYITQATAPPDTSSTSVVLQTSSSPAGPEDTTKIADVACDNAGDKDLLLTESIAVNDNGPLSDRSSNASNSSSTSSSSSSSSSDNSCSCSDGSSADGRATTVSTAAVVSTAGSDEKLTESCQQQRSQVCSGGGRSSSPTLWEELSSAPPRPCFPCHPAHRVSSSYIPWAEHQAQAEQEEQEGIQKSSWSPQLSPSSCSPSSRFTRVSLPAPVFPLPWSPRSLEELPFCEAQLNRSRNLPIRRPYLASFSQHDNHQFRHPTYQYYQHHSLQEDSRSARHQGFSSL